MTCIFCKQSATGASVSHILPASLGGEGWACLPCGLVCSRCNQYFGEKVENLALGSYPFLPFRVHFGIPTRKNRAPAMQTLIGTIRGSLRPGCVGLDPINQKIEDALAAGETVVDYVIAEPAEPVAVCRMLVKMGLEVVGKNSPKDARSSRFDSARKFARCPARGTEWWFLIFTNHTALFSKFASGISRQEWVNGVRLSICRFGEIEVFRLQLLDMVICTPLDIRVLPPDMKEFAEPDNRLFCVKI